MYEKQKPVERNHLRDTPVPAKCCGVIGCGRLTVVFIKEYNVSRCAECYQRDMDNAGLSANKIATELMLQRTKNASA